MARNFSTFSAVFPPAPHFTDKDLPSLTGKVYIITGAASGVGYELAKILYSAGGTVYIAARSASRCTGAITKIENEVTKRGVGRLESMVVDLSDLATVKPAVEAFLASESRLDVLVHNAAVMTPPAGSKDKMVLPLCLLTEDFEADRFDRVMISRSERIVSRRTFSPYFLNPF